MVTHRILHGQHAFLRSIRASAHAHLGEETCLEVVIMEGSPQEIEKLTDRLKAVRGVLFAEAVTTSPDLPWGSSQDFLCLAHGHRPSVDPGSRLLATSAL